MQDSIIQQLAFLGHTPDIIANSLRTLKIKGQQLNCNYCPLANFCKSKSWLKGLWHLNNPSWFTLLLKDAYGLPNNQALLDFIWAFDACDYPDLIQDVD